MISLEKARALKEAGLVWEPDIGDMIYVNGEYGSVIHVNQDDNGKYILIVYVTAGGVTHYLNVYKHDWIWLPRLDQMLAEIEARGYFPRLRKIAGAGYVLTFYAANGKDHVTLMEFISAKTWEDAAADALLWLMGREGK